MTGRAASDRRTDASPLEDQLGFAVRLAQIAIFRDLAAVLKPFDLRLVDFSALWLIEANPGLKQQSLGETLRVQRSNLVAIIDQLEARGLVRRGPAPHDRRSHALTLTPAGSHLLAQAKAEHALHEARVADAVGRDRVAEVRGALDRIAAAFLAL